MQPDPDPKLDDSRWEPGATVAFWINRASRLLLRLHEGRLKPHGFSMGQMPVLLALEEAGPLPQKELAQRARVEQPTMAEMLARMERDGIIEREPDPNDKRASLTSLTRRSRSRLPKAKAAMMQGEHDALAGFTEHEKQALRAFLLRVTENLEAVPAPEKS